MQRKIILPLVLAVAALAYTAAASSTAKHAGASHAGAAAFKVGLSTDIGGLNDRGFNHLAYVGLQQAEKKLGIQGRVVEAASSADYIPNMAALARQGYNLVIGVGFTE